MVTSQKVTSVPLCLGGGRGGGGDSDLEATSDFENKWTPNTVSFNIIKKKGPPIRSLGTLKCWVI